MDINYRLYQHQKICVWMNIFLIVLGVSKGVFLIEYYANLLFLLSIVFTSFVTILVGAVGWKIVQTNNKYWVDTWILLLIYLVFNTCLTPLETLSFYLIFYDFEAYKIVFKTNLVSVNVVLVAYLLVMIPLALRYKSALKSMLEKDRQGSIYSEESYDSLEE